jgi:hypothetical protein
MSNTPTPTKEADSKPQPSDLTARLVAYPSDVIKPVPSFVFSVPKGWVVDEAPDALCVVRTPEQVDDFWVNVILSHDRVARAVDFKSAAQITWAKLQRDSSDAKTTFERLARFGTNVVYLRGAELTAPKTGRKLAQLHGLFFAPVTEGGKTVDFFQFVATSPLDVADRFGPAFVEIIGSFRFV